MITPADLLSNAERLISDAELLFKRGRVRSAATLVVVALEQMGASVEVSTKAEYPDAVIHMDIFGKGANKHAKRQDALAAHVHYFAGHDLLLRTLFQNFIAANDETLLPNDVEQLREAFTSWLKEPRELTEAQSKEYDNYPDVAAARQLLQAVRTNKLQELREYGLYQDVKPFSDDEVREALRLATKIREILSRSYNAPNAPRIAGINMPEAEVLKQREWLRSKRGM
jgi:AbiV family abortive infection protein